jgi:hypothetical protein
VISDEEYDESAMVENVDWAVASPQYLIRFHNSSVSKNPLTGGRKRSREVPPAYYGSVIYLPDGGTSLALMTEPVDQYKILFKPDLRVCGGTCRQTRPSRSRQRSGRC